MEDKLKILETEIFDALTKTTTSKEILELKEVYISKTGKFSLLMRELGRLPKEERPTVSQLINSYKANATQKIDSKLQQILAEELIKRYNSEKIDVTLKSENNLGTLQKTTKILCELLPVLEKMGYMVEEGPDVQNISANDIFSLGDKFSLKSKNSSNISQSLKKFAPPFKLGFISKTFNSDGSFYNNIELINVDKNLNLVDVTNIFYNIVGEVNSQLIPIKTDVLGAGLSLEIFDGQGFQSVMTGGLVNLNYFNNDEFLGIIVSINLDKLSNIKG